jgi:uncharacterized protein
MSDFNSQKNRAVWVDVPVADLDRAQRFYAAVLGIAVHRESFQSFNFCMLDHHDGNGGCLVVKPEEIAANGGLLVYFNVDGRIKDAVAKVEPNGGSIVQPPHSIGPHGFRAVVKDSEGNRIALHSNTDA